ncbi:MAG: hypothetical protein ABI892_08555 [Flavobacterium sp.]
MIIAYVTKVTKAGSPDFISVKDRIATFDNDGTLWAEKTLWSGTIFFLPSEENGRSQSFFSTKTAF